MKEHRIAFKILSGKPTGKRPLGRPRRRWEDSIRMDLKRWVSIRGIGFHRLWSYIYISRDQYICPSRLSTINGCIVTKHCKTTQ